MNRFFRFGLIFLTLFLVLLTNCSGVEDSEPFVTTTSTAIPADVLTRLARLSTELSATQTPRTDYFAQVTQAYLATVQAGAARPTHDWQESYPILPEMIGVEELLGNKLEGTPSGYGILLVEEPPVILHGDEAGAYELSDLAWEQWTYDSFITIWAGQMNASPDQGVLWVQIIPHYKPYQDKIIVQSPIPAGRLNIIGAVKDRLILRSNHGRTFYFDVPSLIFANSLVESVPTATPIPITPLVDPFGTDDAPDLPMDAYTYQPVNTSLDFFINSPQDYDWFLFYSRTLGPITVSLIPEGGNYGLKVVEVYPHDGNGSIMGENTTHGIVRKQVIIPSAPSGHYVVRVWSLDGSFNESQSYTLRFDAPEPERVIPILECVDENFDGTFTAHFGYDNPNPFVVVVNAEDYQNKFGPSPDFRTGQPEGFAPGRVEDWFGVLFEGNDLTWMLDGHAVTANRNSPRCP